MRITVDLDDPTRTDIWVAWSVLSCYGVPQGRISSSGTGVHLKVHGFEGSLEDTIPIRIVAGDDRRRIWYDLYYKEKPRQIMFTSKKGRYSSEWVSDLAVLLYLYETGSRNILIPKL